MVTKTAWKLQEIVAHASNVSSLVLGKASGRLLATGGDDCRVNLWSINKPNCIMSLTGHTSPVESVRLNTPEELIVAGSQSGSIRVWDLEAAKTLGHQEERLCLPIQGAQPGCAMSPVQPRWEVVGVSCR